MSGTKHPLELVLQNYLGTDSTGISHLSQSLLVLGQPGTFDTATSGILGKWNARISSLLHSRDASSRWIGLVLAKHSATSSRHILIENAQGWVGVVLPMLSKAEPFPNYHAGVRLLSYIFTAVTDMPEFQRQVVIPNVQKFSLALLALAKNENSELALQLLAIDTLTQLTTHHPTHHRALQQNLQSFALDLLQGGFPLTSSPSLLRDDSSLSLTSAAIRLLAALPLTGGKVGASVAWRKNLDSTVGTIWNILGVLRRTYGDVTAPMAILSPFILPPLPEDPVICTPLALDRMRCMVRLLLQLLATPTARPVSMPIGLLTQLALKLLQCATAEPAQPPRASYEPMQRLIETTVAPELCTAGCMLVKQLAQTCENFFTPYVSQVLSVITYQLDQPISALQKNQLFAVFQPLLTHTHTSAPSQSNTRIASQLVRALAPLLPSFSLPHQKDQKEEPERKGKKRARYEADELFSSSSSSASSHISANKKVLICALEALESLLPSLPLAIRESIHRTLLTILLHLPRLNEQALAIHVGRVYARCLGEGPTTSGTMGVGVKAIQALPSNTQVGSDAHQILQRFLHPRIPPMSGSGPSIDDLSLFWRDRNGRDEDEEDEETKEFRRGAGIVTAGEATGASGSGVEMEVVVGNLSRVSNGIADSPANKAPCVDYAPQVTHSTFNQSFLPQIIPSASHSNASASATPFGNHGQTSFTSASQVQPTTSPSQNTHFENSKVTSSSIPISPPPALAKPLAPPIPLPATSAGSSSIHASPPPDDDDEAMPTIDLASDTDEDEDEG